MKIDMPDELSDISDLAPPAKTSADDELPAEEPADEEFAEMSLDDLNFDLGLDDLDKDQASPDVHEEAMLALDEIDFSEAPGREQFGNQKKRQSDMDLDCGLDLRPHSAAFHAVKRHGKESPRGKCLVAFKLPNFTTVSFLVFTGVRSQALIIRNR